MLSILLSVVLYSFPSAHAYLENAKTPVCLDGGQEVEIDNAQVLKYKTTTKNNFHARGFVQGKVAESPNRKNGHYHFAISIGPGAKDTIEVVYNYDPDFGDMPEFNVGDDIVVCGDYITSYARSGGYEPSPEGALIHWSHYNPGNRDTVHEHGFVMFGSTLVGFDTAPDSAWGGAITRDTGRSGGNGKNRSRKKGFSADSEGCSSPEECGAG